MINECFVSENNCVDDPVKLCDFQLLENRIMKTVDSVYQVACMSLGLPECIFYKFDIFYYIGFNLNKITMWCSEFLFTQYILVHTHISMQNHFT